MTRHEIGHLLSTTDLRALRKRCGISQMTIARVLGIRQSRISSWECGRRRPAGATGARYARIIAALREHDAITRQLEAEEA